MNKYSVIRKLLNKQWCGFVITCQNGKDYYFNYAKHYNFGLNVFTVYDDNNNSQIFSYYNVLNIR